MSAATDANAPFPSNDERAREIPTGGQDRWETVGSVASWVALAGLTVVVGTGVWLYFFYQPTAAAVWDDIEQAPRSAAVQDAHRLASYLSGVALAVFAIATGVRHRLAGFAYGIGLLGSFAIALLVGFGLPWDQMALWAVNVGAEVRGYSTALDGSNVKFLLIDGRTVSSESLQRLLSAHLFFGAVTAVGVLLPVLHGARKQLRSS